MEVHRQLGMGFKEVLYKDALEIELTQHRIPFSREKQFKIQYKGIELPHKYYADFTVYDKIVLELKSVSYIVDAFIAQTINYLKASGLQLGIICNFGQSSFVYKRIIF